jgi:hypothetical protein
MNLPKTDERLTEAVRSLATGSEWIQERLSRAWGCFNDLNDDDFPEDLRFGLGPIRATLRRLKVAETDRARARERVSDGKAQNTAGLILLLCFDVRKRLEAERRNK